MRNNPSETRSSMRKVDSFFGRNTSGDDEFLIDYIISNEEETNSLLNSNP